MVILLVFVLRSSVNTHDDTTWISSVTEAGDWCYAHPDKTNVVILNTFVTRHQYGSYPDL